MSEKLMEQTRRDLGSRVVAILFVDKSDLVTIVECTSGVLVTLGGRYLVATCGHALSELASHPMLLWYGQYGVRTLPTADGRGLRFANPDYVQACQEVVGRVAWHPDSSDEAPGKLDLGLVEVVKPSAVTACGTVFHSLGVGGVCESVHPQQELRVIGWPWETLTAERSGRHSMVTMDTVITQDFDTFADRFTMAYQDFDPNVTRTNTDGKVYHFQAERLPRAGGMSGGGVWAMVEEGKTAEGVWMPNRFRLAGIQFAAKHNEYLVAMKIAKWLDWAREEIGGWDKAGIPDE